MRLADFVWAVTATVGVGSILAVGKVRQHTEERRLNYDISRRPSARGHHSSHFRGLASSVANDEDVLPRSISTQAPVDIYRPRSRHLYSKTKYPTHTRSTKKKTDTKNHKRNNNARLSFESHRDKSSEPSSLLTMAQKARWANTDRTSYPSKSHHESNGKTDGIHLNSHHARRNQHHHHRSGSSLSDSAVFPSSLTQIKPNSHSAANERGYRPLETPPPSQPSWTSASRTSSSSYLTNPSSARGSTSSSASKYPYSTTFQSFDSFLNSMGTSFKLSGDPHAIRARSDVGKSSFHPADQLHERVLARPGGNSYLSDQPSSQDLYENNALGIDVFEHDRATLLNMPERCCGSKVPLDPDNAKATGGFSRVAAAGSIKVVGVPEKDTDILPPSGVRDLKITVTGRRSIMLTWTTPGDDLDGGKVSRYVVRLSDTRYDLRERRFDQASSYTELDLNDIFQTSGVFQEAGTKVKATVNVDEMTLTRLRAGQQYYLAFRALDDFNNTSPVSNVATFTLPKLPPTTTSTTTTSTTTTTTTTTPPPTTTTTSTTTTTPPPPPPSTTTEPYIAIPETTDSGMRGVPSSGGERNNQQQNQIVPSATLTGRVVAPNTQDEVPRRKKKDRRRKGKGRKNRTRKAKKGKRNKNRDSLEEESTNNPVSQPSSSSSSSSSTTPYDSYKYQMPECLGDNGERVADGKLCDAISSLLTVIDYFEQTREYKHLDYLSSIVVTLRNRAHPHWSGTMV